MTIITCPQCRTDIPLTESLAAPLISATRSKYEAIIADQKRAMADREQSLRDLQTALEQEKSEIDQRVLEQVAAERSRIAAQEATKAKLLVSAELDRKSQELADLQSVIKERDQSLADASGPRPKLSASSVNSTMPDASWSSPSRSA